MKNALTLLLCLWATSYSNLLQSQSGAEYILHEQQSNFSTLAISPGGVAAGGENPGDCDPARLSFYSRQLEPLRDYFPMDSNRHVLGLAGEEGGAWAATGQQQAASEIGEQPSAVFFNRYDENGNLLREKIHREFSISPYYVDILAPAGDGSGHYYLGTEQGLLRLDSVGSILWGLSFSYIHNIRDVAILDNGLVAASNRDSIVVHYSPGAIAWVRENASPAMDMEAMGTDLWWVDLQELHVHPLSGPGASMDFPLPQGGGGGYRLHRYEGQLLLYKTEWGEAQGWWVDTADGSLQPAFQWATPGIRVQKLVLSAPDTAYLAGVWRPVEEVSSGRQLHQGFVKKAPLQEFASDSPFDIGLSRLEANLIDSIEYTFCCGMDTTEVHARAIFEVEADITNFGTETVQDFFVSSISYGSFNCSEGRPFHTFTNAGLASGESITLRDTFLASASAFNTGQPPPLIIKFFTAAPNHRFDGNPGNDSGNQVFSGVSEALSWPSLSIFPNPAAEVATVDCSEEITQLRLFDARGRMLASYRPGSHRFELHRSGLPPGFYYIRVQTKRGWAASLLNWR